VTWHANVMRALASLPGHVVDERYLIAQCDHATLAAAMREAGLVADALIVDAPYSERTHAGHDSAADTADNMERSIEYASWSPADAAHFVKAWGPMTGGWFCTITDHVLGAAWEASLSDHGRYVFSPIACIEIGSRVRALGDGPAQWATWLVPARRRSREAASWGALPGAYVGGKERKAVTGGKPLWLMRAIVSDYSRPGDLVVDPCMGAGTTLVAAVEQGRRAIGCEPDAGRYAIAAKRLAKTKPQLRMRLDCEETRGEQGALFGGE